MPWLLTMSIAATRMHRDLKYSDMYDGSSQAIHDDGNGSGDEMFKLQHAPTWATSITLDNLENGGHSRRGEIERDVTDGLSSQ